MHLNSILYQVYLVRTAELRLQTCSEHLVVIVKTKQSHKTICHYVQFRVGNIVAKNWFWGVEKYNLL